MDDGIKPYEEVNMRQLNSMDARLSGGIALSSALSGTHPNARIENDTQLSMGFGHYNNETAVEVGAFHYIDDRALINVGVSYVSEDSQPAVKGGVTWGF